MNNPTPMQCLPLFLLLAVTASTPTTLRTLYGLKRPTSVDAPHTALVLVDFQREFFDGRLPLPDGPQAARHAAELLGWARGAGVMVVHVRNVTKPNSLLFAPGSPTAAFVDEVTPAPTETVVTKSMAGAFSRTDLDAILRARGITTVIVAGLMTHLAVDTTAKDAMVLGYQVIVAADASATRDLPGVVGAPEIDHATLHRVALASLADRFADVMTTGEIMALAPAR